MKTIDELQALMSERQAIERTKILEQSNRSHSALALANMALEHGSSSAKAAAKFLLSMEREEAFDFRLLLKFDSTNRAHADLLLMGYQAHELWPSRWMDEIGEDGAAIMQALADKWLKSKSE